MKYIKDIARKVRNAFQKFRLQNLTEKIKKSNVAIATGIVIFLFSSFSTLYQGFNLFKSTYSNTIGSKQALLQEISKLAPGANFEYFKSILGTPIFTNKVKKGISENIFVNKYSYIQAVVEDSTDTVLMYSVTTRDRNFNPVFTLPNDQKLYLGKSTFSSLKSDYNEEELNSNLEDKYDDFRFSDQILFNLGAHNWSYIEKFWFGNPGNYLNYIVSDNQAGFENWEGKVDFPDSEDDANHSKLVKFRNHAVINTFSVTAPFVFLKDIGFINGFVDNGLQIGPNYNQIRVMSE